MPYEIEKRGGKFCVVNQDTGKTRGCCPTLMKAKAFMKACYAHAPEGEKKSGGKK